MQNIISVDLARLLAALSMALDFTAHGLSQHHRRVAYISVIMGKAMGLDSQTLRTLFCAASVHDIGAITFAEKSHLVRFEIQSPQLHCEKGFEMLRQAPHFRDIATIIRHHHDKWSERNPQDFPGDESLLLLGDLIHLADRIEVMLTQNYLLAQRQSVLKRIDELFGSVFRPELQEILHEAALKESFWLDMESVFIQDQTLKAIGTIDHMMELPYADLKGLASIFARIIDSKSRFTLRHSRLVSASATHLSRLAGFCGAEQARMEVAGLLHDLGKLSIPEDILEKPGALTNEEYLVIKKHTYYTYRILDHIPGFSEIAKWGAYHHERIDGRGYPFHIPGDELSLGSRIVAVADIFSALVEDRPYRAGLGQGKVESILRKMTQEQAIDGELVHLLLRRYDEFEEIKNGLP
ncbi:HD domain-containing protein [Heliobacillus mobilis]|uniref:HD domain-containing protein n=1 Tax=Heliobacterium mobile TaxID=28064 RepID=A0A6I3SIK4_HELMO|nr:HD domain-containing phosphohydrolase [Heliobacterium mobile]MTV48729.1 HD domain-containing protein [Heliobacterium mobile]